MLPAGGGTTTMIMLVGGNIDFFVWNADEVDVLALGNYSQFIHFTIVVLELDTSFDIDVIYGLHKLEHRRNL